MPARPLVHAAIAAAVVALFGCSYTAERETTVHRLMKDEGVCPPAEAVAEESRGESISYGAPITDADRTAWRRVEMTPVCWYRVAWEGSSPPCDESSPSLEELRAKGRYAFPPLITGEKRPEDPVAQCTSDGPVVMVEADGPACAPSFSGEIPRRAEDGRWWRGNLSAGELIGSEDRPAYRLCIYEIETEYTHRPFSCGSGLRLMG